MEGRDHGPGRGPVQVDPDEHDIGLVFLASPIQLQAYPLLAQKPLAAGAKVLNIGRIHHGQVSNSSLFVSKPVTVTPGSSLGFPYDYAAVDRIEPGDSGGPDVLPGAAPHTIVAVSSGARLEAACDPCVAEVCSADPALRGGSGDGAEWLLLSCAPVAGDVAFVLAGHDEGAPP